MKRFLAKFTAVSVLCALVLSSCTGAPANGGESSNDSSADASQSSAVSSDASFPLKEEVELTALMIGPFDNPNYNDNYTTEWIKEKTNIKLNFTYQLSGDDGKTKLNLLMAGGEKLPDVFISTKWTKAETMMYGKQGLVVPLNDYLKDATNFNKYYDANPIRKGDITMTDGNIYSFGSINECYHCMYQARMWVYKPWIDKLVGGKLPTTTDELYTYLKAIKDNDPNGNGQKDEIPYTALVGGWANDPMTFISNAFLQNNNMLSNTNPVVGAGFIINNDTVEFQFTKDEYRKALEYMNKLYKEGLLDPQAFTQDGTQMSASCNSETQLVGMAPGGWFPCNTDELSANKPGKWQDWIALNPVKGPDGVQLAAYYPAETFGSCLGLVSADCKDPALAVKLFDFLLSEEATLTQTLGPEGAGWQYVDEGKSISGEKALYERLPTTKFKEDGTTPDYSDKGFKQAKYTWESDASIINNTSDWRLAQLCADPSMDSEGLLFNFAKGYSQYKPDDKSIFPNIAYSEEQARQLNDYSVAIGGYVNQATVQFITGDLDIAKDWQSYLDKIKSMDLEGYIKLQQDAYTAFAANIK